MAKLLALLSVLAVGYGLSTAFAQQAPTENKGIKTDPYRGFSSESRVRTTLPNANFASVRSPSSRVELPLFIATRSVLRSLT